MSAIGVPIGCFVGGMVIYAIVPALYRALVPVKRPIFQDIPVSGKPGGTITLYAMSNGSHKTISPSPFVAKVEAFFRMAGLEYTFKDALKDSNFTKNPQRKMPFIAYLEPGASKPIIISDSQLIIRFFMNTYGSKLQHLNGTNPKVKAVATLARTALEADTYWKGLSDYWSHDEFCLITRELYFSHFPFLLRYIIFNVTRPSMIRNLRGQGTGRFSDNDNRYLTDLVMDAIEVVLSDRSLCPGPFFGGDKAILEDAAIFGFLDTVTHSFLPEGRDHRKMRLRQSPGMIAYHARFRATYFQDKN